MKKNVLIWALVGIGTLYSCKKENSISSKHHQSELMNAQSLNMIEINSAEDLEQFYNDEDFRNSIIEASTYTPLSNNIAALDHLVEEEDSVGLWTSPYLSDTIFQDYGPLLQLLNTDKQVKLGDYIVKIDLHQEKVYLSSIEAAGDIQTAINNLNTIDFNSDIVQEFSTDVEVVPLIFKLKIFCKDGYAKSDKSFDNEKSECNSKKRVLKHVKYLQAGVYYSLIAEGKAQKKKVGIWWRAGDVDDLEIPNVNFAYQFRCNDGMIHSYSGSPSGLSGHSNNNGRVYYRPYHGIRPLYKYYYYVEVAGCNETLQMVIQSN